MRIRPSATSILRPPAASVPQMTIRGVRSVIVLKPPGPFQSFSDPLGLVQLISQGTQQDGVPDFRPDGLQGRQATPHEFEALFDLAEFSAGPAKIDFAYGGPKLHAVFLSNSDDFLGTLLYKQRLASELMQLSDKASGIGQALRMRKLSRVFQSDLHSLHGSIWKSKSPQCFARRTLTQHFAITPANQNMREGLVHRIEVRCLIHVFKRFGASADFQQRGAPRPVYFHDQPGILELLGNVQYLICNLQSAAGICTVHRNWQQHRDTTYNSVMVSGGMAMPIHDWTRVDAGTFHAFHTS